MKLTRLEARGLVSRDLKNLSHRNEKGAPELFDAPQVPVPFLLREGQEGGQIFKFTAGVHNTKGQNLTNN